MHPERVASLAGLVLVIGGFGGIGAGAGVYVAQVQAAGLLACGGLDAGAACNELLARLSSLTQTFLVAGGLSMVCGAVVLTLLRRGAAE